MHLFSQWAFKSTQFDVYIRTVIWEQITYLCALFITIILHAKDFAIDNVCKYGNSSKRVNFILFMSLLYQNK